MRRLRPWWPEVFVVFGVYLLARGFSGLSGDVSIGESGGAGYVGYGYAEQNQITGGAAFVAIGALALFHRLMEKLLAIESSLNAIKRDTDDIHQKIPYRDVNGDIIPGI